MPDHFLVFQLYGFMASWGDVAVGEIRPSFDRPSKSAVLGLVAAALGISRDDASTHDSLANDYGFAVRIDKPGALLQDYHTVQMPSGKGGRNLPTRGDEIRYSKLGTLLSTRAYLTDALATVSLWPRTSSPCWSLHTIQEHLESPRFTLYLGRKACPPSWPLAPAVIPASTVRKALGSYDEHQPDLGQALKECLADGKTSQSMRVYFDSDGPHGFEQQPVSVVRRDAPLHRTRWLFDDRLEAYIDL